jgi:hypothetical protein
MGTIIYRQRKKRSSELLVAVAAFLLVVALAAGAWFAFLRPDNTNVADTQQNAQSEDEQQTEPEKPQLVALQPVVDEWLAKQPTNLGFGIVVYDPANQQIIASHDPDRKFFAASLYKLFVAYLALVDFQNGAQDPDEMLWGGFTRKECVDKMVRESHSPCGEAMMADMGQESLRQRVANMGIANTIFAGINTTARDSAIILQYIVEGRDLNAENTAFLRDAMRHHPERYRGALVVGAPEATWDTKVGWNETYQYHDVGIATLPNGREYVVAVLTQNNGSPTPIADFAKTIYVALAE